MTADEIKTLLKSPDYYNRYNKAKNWSHVAVLAGRAMQSAEINESQLIAEDKIKAIGSSLYADGTIIKGCAITLDTNAKKASLEAGRIFLDGLVYEVEEKTLDVPDDEDVQVGIWQKFSVLTEYEDDTLNDQARNTPQYMMPGAWRVITVAEWGLNTDNLDAPFFPVYGISGGEIVTQLQKINPEYLNTTARYDRHANGHYVVEGLNVTALASIESGKQTYSISEGIAHINGYEAEIGHSVRLITDEAFDLAEVQSEVHRFTSGGTGRMAFTVAHTPIESVSQVRVTKERTVTLTHGNYSGCVDALPNDSVFEVVEVRQGALIFVEGTDFLLDGDNLDWSPTGEEPSPGATYTAKYHYRTNIRPDSFTTKSITVSGLFENSVIEASYYYRMPRKDIIVMYKDCSIGIVRGISHRYDPVLPGTPPEAICLAQVTQTWDGLPAVRNVAIKCVHADVLNEMRSQILDLYGLLARQELRFDATLNAPTSAYNVFVDSLFDDDMRDAGTPQTALIADQTLQLPLSIEISELTLAKDTVLDFDVDVLIDQSAHTRDMKVNPYQAFNPLPATMTLTPAVDRWTENIVRSVISNTVSFRSSNRRHSWDTLTDTVTTTETGGNLRSISVRIDASGFGPNEAVKVIFDGIEVACSSAMANASGVFSGTFTIPEGVPVGTKLVRLQGTFTTASAYFVGIHEVRTTINYYVRYNDLDPLAQTFTLSEARHVAGVDFWLVSKSRTSSLKIELHEVSLGFPTQEVIASCILKPDQLTAKAWNRAIFDTPVFLSADTEYAITIMTDTADYSVGIASLGDWDTSKGWIRSQAYSAGVLLSSSNASTWSADQKSDLTFRLLGARFRTARKTIAFGSIELAGVTDIMPMAEVQRTGADTDATFILKKGSVEVARMQAWQNISFSEPLNGTYSLSVELFGDSKYSPLLGRMPQILKAKIANTGDYVSRAFVCGMGKQVMITTEEFAPTGSSISVYIETAANVWTQAEDSESEQIGDGWIRCKRFIPCDMAATRLKIVLNGSSSARPLVQNISAVILNA